MRGTTGKLPDYIAELQLLVEKHAREAGLDFFDVIFEVVSLEEMNEIAAYGGFPSRYPHWRFGMEYNRLGKSSTYGLHRIYEMVINNDPCYAYLLEGNSLVEHKMVMAHVMAHCDFFKNNFFFKNTNRKMMNEMANHRSKISALMDKLGIETVEWFLDACLSIDNLIDVVRGPHSHREEKKEDLLTVSKIHDERKKSENGKSSKQYMEPFISTSTPEKQKKVEEEPQVQIPSGKLHSPTKDVMGFLLCYAPLKDWEQTVLEIVRDEAYYFAPQAQTKILNEGWATYWHSKLMTEKLLSASEVIDYADRASSITASVGLYLNPYKLGLELLRDIEFRWDRGRFGKEWEECTDSERRTTWDTGAGLGKKKLFEVRSVYNDIMFIDEFLTEEFCRENKLFSFGYNEKTERYEIESREFTKIKNTLLMNLTNLGNPVIEVIDANFENKGELLLRHLHEGIDLRIDWAKDTLANIFKIWKRPVCISTIISGTPTILRYDGKEHTQTVTHDAT